MAVVNIMFGVVSPCSLHHFIHLINCTFHLTVILNNIWLSYLLFFPFYKHVLVWKLEVRLIFWNILQHHPDCTENWLCQLFRCILIGTHLLFSQDLPTNVRFQKLNILTICTLAKKLLVVVLRSESL